MFAKLCTLTVLLTATIAGLLMLRQQRLEMAHESATLHRRIVQARQELWSAQTRAADLLRPDDLQRRVKQSELVLEPATPPLLIDSNRFVQDTGR